MRMDIVLSGSMEPELTVGSLAVTQTVSTEDIKVGDIITFSSPLNGKLITHRVIAIKNNPQLKFHTKGDANEEADPYIVSTNNVVGKVCFHLPYFGHVNQFVKTPLGFILTLGIPGIVIILIELKNIWYAIHEEESSV
jgi:signal peptidase